MKIIESDVAVIGGGLTGLAIAYLLSAQNISVNIIEARERLGGRIYTEYGNGTKSVEMGATWLGKKHSVLLDLLEELDIGTFEQVLGERAIFEPISTSRPQLVTLPPNSDPSFRIKGGSSMLINTLAKNLKSDQIHTKQVVKSIEKGANLLSIKSNTHEFKASSVISTLPPYLLTQMIKISPELPASLLEIAENTHTWMGESIKVALTYKTPFWRGKNLSGTIFSNVGPIPEMYDHADYQDKIFALKGFFNGSYYSVSREERLSLVLKQLNKYFGKQVENYLSYEETVWRKESFTFSDYQAHILPHQNNGHPVYRKAYLDGKLFIAGSETAANFPGYMDGAIRSAKFVCQEIEKGK